MYEIFENITISVGIIDQKPVVHNNMYVNQCKTSGIRSTQAAVTKMLIVLILLSADDKIS